MKRCAVCGLKTDSDDPTCLNCGEASWQYDSGIPNEEEMSPTERAVLQTDEETPLKVSRKRK